MNKEQYDALVAQLGKDAADQIAAKWAGAEAKMKEIALEAVKQGGITEDRFKEYEKASTDALSEVKEIARKQGVTLQELAQKITTHGSGVKSIAEVLEENATELMKVYQQGSGVKTFMIHQKADGGFTARPFDMTASKAAGITGTVAGLDGSGAGSASIAQSIGSAELLRLGGGSPIISQYRNTSWLFDLVNVIQAGWDMPFAMYFEEVAKQGSSTVVAEGAPKPKVQYAYTLKTAPYKKEAQLITFTDEFSLDFPRLQSDILGKGRTDLMNDINAALLTDLLSAATAYNSAAAFNGGVAMTGVNDFDVIAAMAAQVDNNTFGSIANAAIMSTYKKYRMGITKDDNGGYLNRPEVLNNLAFLGNPGVGNDNVIVGDLKQMNLILRGGMIVKVGYNGTDFAENKFSVVQEQYFFDYISTIRKAAIVKGTTFANVKAALEA